MMTDKIKNAMEYIRVEMPNGGIILCRYLEDLAEKLGKIHNRQINIAEELESQITDNNGCYFTIDGKQYYYKQIEL